MKMWNVWMVGLTVATWLVAVDVASQENAPPKPLEATETLSVEWSDKRGYRVFSDTTGSLWQMGSGGLLRWDGKTRTWKETETIPSPPPRPQWWARPSEPWSSWSYHEPRLLVGKNGSLLFVEIRDVYQGMEVERDNWGKIYDEGRKLAETRGHFFWAEARLYRDGKWSESVALDDLITTERAYLVKNFASNDFSRQFVPLAFFDLQVSGTDLWWSDGLEMKCLDGEGKLAKWTIPIDLEKVKSRTWHLSVVKLVNLGEGKMRCFVSSREDHAFLLTRVKDDIQSTPRPDTKFPRYTSGHKVFRAQNGTMWLEAQVSGFVTFALRDEKWVNVYEEKLGRLIWEDDEGRLWFGMSSVSKGITIVAKDNTRLLLPMHRPFPPGPIIITMIDKNKLLVTDAKQVSLLVRDEGEIGWVVKDVLGLDFGKPVYEGGGIWLDGHGHLVGASGWSAKLPEAKLADWSAASEPGD